MRSVQHSTRLHCISLIVLVISALTSQCCHSTMALFRIPTFLFLASSAFVGVATATVPDSGLSSTVDNERQRILFQKFIQDFGKQYTTDTEREYRFGIFQNNLAQIDRHNNDAKSTYELGITSFADLLSQELPFGHDKSQNAQFSSSSSFSTTTTTGGMNYLRGNATTTAAPKLNKFRGDIFELVDLSVLPKEVDWRKHNPPITTPIKNQLSCGSCWAFAATAVLESHIALQTSTLFELSEQELVSCVHNPHHCGGNGGCTGSTVEIAFDFVSQHGMVDEWSFGYQSGHGAKVNCTIMDEQDQSNIKDKNKNTPPSGTKIKGAVASIVGFASLPSNSYRNLLQAVATMGPVAVSVAASSWGLYKGGVFDDSKDEHRDINHAVVLEGYGTDESTGEDFWLIRNSWGPSWGEGGRIRLKRVDPSTLDDPSSDCKTDITPSDGIACTKDDNGNDVVPPNVVVCGTSGVLFDSAIPIGGHLLT
jgi:cathepsin L